MDSRDQQSGLWQHLGRRASVVVSAEGVSGKSWHFWLRLCLLTGYIPKQSYCIMHRQSRVSRVGIYHYQDLGMQIWVRRAL